MKLFFKIEIQTKFLISPVYWPTTFGKGQDQEIYLMFQFSYMMNLMKLFNMSSPIRSVLKSFSTDVTNIRFQPTVHIQMPFEVLCALKPLRTDVAFERLLGVIHVHGYHVSSHVVTCVEHFVTLITFNCRSSVFSHVQLQSNL